MLFLTRKRKIRALMWYVNVKNATFFCLCVLSVITLILTFGFSTLLSNTLGTGVAYMIILFMVPMDIVLIVDLYLCITCKYYLEERVWRAQPKVQHKRKNDDENEEPVKTELIRNTGDVDETMDTI